MASDGVLGKAREAFGRRAWSAARTAYASVGDHPALSLDDIEKYAVAAHLSGEERECCDVMGRGYRESLQRDDVSRAARFAYWLGLRLMFAGEMGQASGWFTRARGLLTERGVDCVEWGYLMIADGVEQLEAGDATAACSTFAEAQTIARRFGDTDLLADAGHGRGRALIRLGLHGEGMAVLDEVMVAVTSGEVSPMSAGDIYCGVLEACHEVFDLRRAREWTAALTRWCEGQTDLVPHRGPCLVHRVEVMRLRGDWDDAFDEARRACDWLSLPATPEGAADAFYELGELHRLRGDFSPAEEAYRQASRLGRSAEPGLALLWLACGRSDSAANAVSRALGELPGDRARRAELLAAYVEIMLVQREVAAAQRAAVELSDLAEAIDAPSLRALADRASGSVLIASSEPGAGLAHLRRSWTAWQQLDAPYEAARVRVLIGKACQDLGDEESAAMEFDAARWIFERLGAAPDLAQLQAITRRTESGAGLTQREIEVLRLIATGETNKEIAAALVISEHTVARHVQNMLQKLGFSSRASLAAYAVKEGIADPSSAQN